MKLALTTVSIVVLSQGLALADTYVKGYARKNGTYVQPHVRSDVDSARWNNYGASGGVDMMNGKNRDADKDSTPNYLDHDDNNNGIPDDSDNHQYRHY